MDCQVHLCWKSVMPNGAKSNSSTNPEFCLCWEYFHSSALLGAKHGNVAWKRERVDSCSTFPRLQIKLISLIYWATLEPESGPESRCSKHRRSHGTKATDLPWTLYKPASDSSDKQALKISFEFFSVDVAFDNLVFVKMSFTWSRTDTERRLQELFLFRSHFQIQTTEPEPSVLELLATLSRTQKIKRYSSPRG